MNQAIIIYRQYGEETRGIARSEYKLSLVLRDLGRIAEADEVKQRAARLRKKVLGVEPEEQDDETGYDPLIMFVDH